MNILLILGIIAGCLTSIGIIWTKFVKPFGRFIRRAIEAYDIVAEFPIWQEEVNDSLRELQPNHGHSMKDRVDRISLDLPVVKLMIEEHILNARIHRL